MSPDSKLDISMASKRIYPATGGEKVITHNFRFTKFISEDESAGSMPFSTGEIIVKDEGMKVTLEDSDQTMVKRVTQYGKMVVCMVKTEVMDCAGNVVEVTTEELDEESLVYRRSVSFGDEKEPKEESEVELQAQSVRKPLVSEVKVPYAELNKLTIDQMQQRHVVEDCREKRDEYPYET
jgi:hypothetical protein